MGSNPNLAPRGAIGMRLCNELEGLLRGIQADRRILPEETARIAAWLECNRQFAATRPFIEIAEKLEHSLADGALSSEEIEDLLFVACRYTGHNPHFDQQRAGLQVLMGLLSGYAADAVIPESEVRHLQDWIEDWRHLRGLWPYDECESIVTWMLSRGRITEEAGHLIDLSRCVPVSGAATDASQVPALTLAGICSVDPEIVFPERQFVFTGESERGGRAHLETNVIDRRGRTHDKVTKAIDYLVVCDQGNPHWAFSCYGRKVEQAFRMRQEGHRVVIVHERDFWDALVV